MSDSFQFTGRQAYYGIFRTALWRESIFPVYVTKTSTLNDRFEAEIQASKNPLILRMIDLYLQPGTDEWERTFGDLWDEAYSRDCHLTF